MIFTAQKPFSRRFTAPFAVLLLILIVLSTVSTPVATADSVPQNEGIQKASAMLFELITFATGTPGATPEEWISGSLLTDPQLKEWYAIGISRLVPETDLSKYADALEKYLQDNTVYSATTRQKYGMALIACGKPDSPYLEKLIDETAGKQGIMSYVFALHLLTNGASSELYTAEKLIPVLLKLQCEDGGWSLTGKSADVDVTAMTAQALAPYYNAYPRVKTAIDAAISRLSAMQEADGGFSSYGKSNPESSAQVIIALTSLGRDPLTDEAFIKNGKSPLDAISDYRLSNGSYCHEKNGAYNLSATSQTFMALSALLSDTEKKPFFLFIDAPVDFPALDNSIADSLPDKNSPENGDNTVNSGENGEDKDETKPHGAYKLPVCIGITVVAVAVCIVMFIKKRRAISDYLIVVGIAALLCAGVVFINVYTPDQYYGQSVKKDEPIGSVTLEIVCDAELTGRKDTVILGKTAIEIEGNETVYDLLAQACRANKIILDAMASSPTGGVYIRGIDGLHEFAHGDLSGWTYTVNGEKINIGCDKYIPKDGDVIVWSYSNTLGD